MITEDKDALVAEIEKLKDSDPYYPTLAERYAYNNGVSDAIDKIYSLEVKEVDEQKERMSECPYRQVGCTMYDGHILECKGACSWVVDYPKLKELKAQKGE